MTAKKLRPRQERILEFIKEYLDEYDYPPTIREIGTAAGISSTSVVNYNLERLESMGYIERNREVSRGLRLVGYAGGQKTREVPLYGNIAAGNPLPMPEDPSSVMENVDVPVGLLPSVETGEMAVAEILDSPEQTGATLKRFYLHKNQVELRPANPDDAYQSFWLKPDQVKVYGKVVVVLRQYD